LSQHHKGVERVIKKEIFVPFPLLGVPIKGIYFPFVALPSKIKCVVDVKLIKSREAEGYINRVGDELNQLSLVFLSKLFDELDIELQPIVSIYSCSSEPPSISLLAVITAEVFKTVSRLRHSDYRLALSLLGMLDEKVLGIDPGYITALRCAYLFNSLCIARGYDEFVKLGHRFVEVVKIFEIPYTSAYKAIENPYDKVVMSLIYKMATHVISFLAQNTDAWSEESYNQVRKYIALYYLVESGMIREALKLNDIPVVHNIKHVIDINDIKSYRVVAIV
jgi:hypothetical protein